MNEKIFELIATIIVNFNDCVMVYYLCNNLVEKEPKLTIKTILLGVLFGTVMGLVAYYIGGYLHQLLAFFNVMLILRLVSKKRVYDVLILLVIVLLCVGGVEILVLVILTILNTDNSNEVLFVLLAQTLTIISIIFIYIKVPLYKLLNFVEREILLKLFIFILASIFLMAGCYSNFEYTNMIPYLLYFSILIVSSFFGLYGTLKELFYYTKKVPMQLHDTKNILIGLYISAHDTTDIHSIRDTIEKCMEIMGMDSNFLKNTKVGERKENILSFINYKKLKSTKKLIFITNIYYCELHPNVPFSVILYMLGTLLDNAIESKTNKPILMEVYVAKEKLEISVANEYNQKNRDDFEKMFQEGYSSKSTKQLTPSRGYGLSNLSSVVKSYGGDVLLEYGYNKEQKGDYLTIKIEIKT